MIKTSELTELLKYKGIAECKFGEFKGLHATKNEAGHVILIEEDIAYDFWDMRFTNCQWAIQ